MKVRRKAVDGALGLRASTHVVLLGIDMSEERLRSLVQHSSDIITVVDADGTILYESTTVERGLGYKPEEQVGKHTFDFVHPGDLEQVRKIFTEALAKPGPTQRAEVRCRHADGSWRYLEALGNNLLEDHVTECKQAERILRESEERYRAVVETAAESIFLVDIETKGIVQTNAAFRNLLGYSSEEIAGLRSYRHAISGAGGFRRQDSLGRSRRRPGGHGLSRSKPSRIVASPDGAKSIEGSFGCLGAREKANGLPIRAAF